LDWTYFKKNFAAVASRLDGVREGFFDETVAGSMVKVSGLRSDSTIVMCVSCLVRASEFEPVVLGVVLCVCPVVRAS
jgi:hypothetical protein